MSRLRCPVLSGDVPFCPVSMSRLFCTLLPFIFVPDEPNPVIVHCDDFLIEHLGGGPLECFFLRILISAGEDAFVKMFPPPVRWNGRGAGRRAWIASLARGCDDVAEAF